MISSIRQVVIIAVALGLFNCCSPLNKQDDIVSDRNSQHFTITEKYWKLTELEGQKIVTDTNQPKDIYLMLKVSENRIKGFGGCNTFFGTYELLDGNRIKLSGIGSTMMACPSLKTESLFFNVLQSIDNYSLNGDTLYLNKARMAPLARFESVHFE